LRLRFDEARPHIDRARELDPLTPWNDVNLVGWWLYQGRPEKAFEEAERARRRNPTLWILRWQMGFAQLLLGQPGQAVPEFEAAVELLLGERPSNERLFGDLRPWQTPACSTPKTGLTDFCLDSLCRAKSNDLIQVKEGEMKRVCVVEGGFHVADRRSRLDGVQRGGCRPGQPKA